MTWFKKALTPLLALLLLLAFLVGFSTRLTASAYAPEKIAAERLTVNAPAALLMDYHTGTVVFAHNETARRPIASMVKIMTLNLIFDEIKKGSLSIDTAINAGPNATAMGGSQAFLDTNAQYKTGDLIRSIVVASANDSCVAMAEHISGSVEEFVAKMNQRAGELGMADTNFANCTGLPSPNGYSSARDVAIMTRELLSNPGFYDYAKIWMFDFQHPGGRFTSLSNTNKLLRAYEGCDGGKTGFTNEASYCLSATARRGNTRLISVVMGAATSKERNAENAKLFNYGFANYETKTLIQKGTPAPDPATVTGGKSDAVTLSTDSDLYYFGKKAKADIAYEYSVTPLTAPVAAGQIAGECTVKINGETIGKVNLITDTAIDKKTYLDIINELISKW